MEKTLNVGSKSKDWREYCLSNFPPFPFVLDGKIYASVEGFVQGIKYPFDHPNRELAFVSFSSTAKHWGDAAEREFVWYGGEIISYGTAEHHRLIGRAIRAKFKQNTGAMLALSATKGFTLIHDTGTPDSPSTSLPREIFCDILTRIRDEH
jgi:predicted NAD-dependent protein-ADP-ribosyltransferase YbiA (DUF1768 family)